MSSPEYSLGAKCVSESFGMALVIFISESILANHILPHTKGNSIGFGWVAFGFGSAIYIGILLFAFISARLNPALHFADLILGSISFTTFLALSASNFFGAFIGATLVWLHYLPFFKTVPEPPGLEPASDLIHRRDTLGPMVLNYALQKQREGVGEGGLGGVLADLRFYLAQGPGKMGVYSQNEIHELIGETNPQRRRSIQVGDLHTRLVKKDTQIGPTASPAASLPHQLPARTAERATWGQHSLGSEGVEERGAEGVVVDVQQRSSSAHVPGDPPPNGHSLRQRFPSARPITPTSILPQAHSTDPASAPTTATRPNEDTGDDEDAAMLLETYRAAVRADASAKLVVFASRPAILVPVLNLVQETLCGGVLCFGCLMMDHVADSLPEGDRLSFMLVQRPLLRALMIFALILGLGGPTGFAANPARDIGPRTAHWLLPIPGKGPSEWGYAWVPGLGPMVGGAIAAGLVKMFESVRIG